ncbi:hypothetical protein GMJAKD_04855 [Candidatus Electrothrix aarhusensis]
MHYRTPFFSFITVACFLGAFCMFNPTDVSAEAVRAMQWEITADKLTKFEDPASVIAEGNVILRKMENITGVAKKKKVTKDWGDLLGEDTSPTDGNTLPKKGGEATLISPKKAPALQDASSDSEEEKKLSALLLSAPSRQIGWCMIWIWERSSCAETCLLISARIS